MMKRHKCILKAQQAIQIQFGSRRLLRGAVSSCVGSKFLLLINE